MEVGRDILENVKLLDGIFVDDLGELYFWEGVVVIYEWQGGLFWLYFDFDLIEEIEFCCS